MKRMAEVKDSLDIDVKQNFIDPLQGLCDKDLREIQVPETLTACYTMGKLSNGLTFLYHFILISSAPPQEA